MYTCIHSFPASSILHTSTVICEKRRVRVGRPKTPLENMKFVSKILKKNEKIMIKLSIKWIILKAFRLGLRMRLWCGHGSCTSLFLAIVSPWFENYINEMKIKNLPKVSVHIRPRRHLKRLGTIHAAAVSQSVSQAYSEQPYIWIYEPL